VIFTSDFGHDIADFPRCLLQDGILLDDVLIAAKNPANVYEQDESYEIISGSPEFVAVGVTVVGAVRFRAQETLGIRVCDETLFAEGRICGLFNQMTRAGAAVSGRF